MLSCDNRLFSDGDLEATLRRRLEKISSMVDTMPEDELGAREDEIIGYVRASLRIEPLTLNVASAEMEQDETEIDLSSDQGRRQFSIREQNYVPGIRVVVSIQYRGAPILWKLNPHSFRSRFPVANVRRPNSEGVGHIDIIIEQPADWPHERIKQSLDEKLESIKLHMEAQKTQVERFNESLADHTRRAIAARKERLKAANSVADLLDIPLKQTGDALQQQVKSVETTTATSVPAQQRLSCGSEPTVSDEHYERILSVIRHEGRAIEIAPKAYAVHDDEGFRDIVLAHLNGISQDGVADDRFRQSGKAGVCAVDQERAVFVAECQVWRGASELTAALDRLSSYLSWQDCKGAILVFNKNHGAFEELLPKVPGVLRRHARFKKDLGQRGNGEWRFVFSSIDGHDRQVILSLFVFNVHVG